MYSQVTIKPIVSLYHLASVYKPNFKHTFSTSYSVRRLLTSEWAHEDDVIDARVPRTIEKNYFNASYDKARVESHIYTSLIDITV